MSLTNKDIRSPDFTSLKSDRCTFLPPRAASPSRWHASLLPETWRTTRLHASPPQCCPRCPRTPLSLPFPLVLRGRKENKTTNQDARLCSSDPCLIQQAVLCWHSPSLLYFPLPMSHKHCSLSFTKSLSLDLRALFFLFSFQCLRILLLISWQTSLSRHLSPNVTRLAQLKSQDSNPDPMMIYQCLSSPPSLPPLVPVHGTHAQNYTPSPGLLLSPRVRQTTVCFKFLPQSPPLTNSTHYLSQACSLTLILKDAVPDDKSRILGNIISITPATNTHTHTHTL